MCDVVYFEGIPEQTIPGNQITALAFPLEQKTYNWEPPIGGLADVLANAFVWHLITRRASGR